MFQSLSVFPSRAIITLTLAGYAYSFSTFHWPNPLLWYADKQMYEGSLGPIVQGCTSRDNTTIPAQWLRIAYHDMSTHNVDDGTGGLDASIQYELDRPQNIGQGMFDSLNDFNTATFGIVTPFFGMADTIALGAVVSVAACGGPLIPYSTGRVDATVAGPETVPEPQQDLASHTEAFRRQGFTPTEMIALVACGHTLGGVRQADFPLVVTDIEEDLRTFDTTTNFDNTVVSEYLQNTTDNILVVGPNITTRSDFRVTEMQPCRGVLLSPDTFNETCGNLIGRMINTVPQGVNLTEPISEPFDYVVSEPLLSYRNGTLSMATTLRVINPSDNPSRTITMLWADRQGSFCPATGCTSPSIGTQEVFLGLIGNIQGLQAQRYVFNASINATTSISKLWFEINENDGSSPVVVDNGGSGFVVEQDSVFVDNSRSENVFLSVSMQEYWRLVLAVRGDASSKVSIITFRPISTASVPPYLPNITTTDLQLDESNPSDEGFTFFTANVSLSVTVNFLSIVANIDGITYTQENYDMTTADFPFVMISQ